MFRFFVLFALFLSPLSADSIPSIPNLFFPEDSVRNKVGAQDNRLIFQLGEMCREPDMQSARFWWRHSFYPATVND
jgi:hypothetical protein